MNPGVRRVLLEIYKSNGFGKTDEWRNLPWENLMVECSLLKMHWELNQGFDILFSPRDIATFLRDKWAEESQPLTATGNDQNRGLASIREDLATNSSEGPPVALGDRSAPPITREKTLFPQSRQRSRRISRMFPRT